jgi:oligopeptide transport system permease protein
VSILAFALRRVLWAVPLLLLVMLATFALLRGMGGDPFVLPEGFVGLPLPVERDLREYYRIDEPWFVEFAHYVANVARFDFGPSLNRRGLSVDAVIERSLPVTAQLVALAALVAVPAGFALGLLGALRRRTPADTATTAVSTVLLVVPVFFVAWLLSRYPALEWHWFPLGWESWDARVLPVLTLALAPAGYIARLVRAAVVETLGEDYVRTARAKGLRRGRIVLVHVLRNSLVPVLSAAVPMLALLITGAFFVEEYFGVPGASNAFLLAARVRDFPMVMGLTVVLAAIVITLNLVTDVVIAVLDPRVREHR